MKLTAFSAYSAVLLSALTSLLALFMGGPAMPAFYAFLPMCFFLLGANLYAANKEIAVLRKRLDEMKG